MHLPVARYYEPEVGTVKYSQTSDPVTFDCQVLASRDT
jgi:hypothetical protein